MWLHWEGRFTRRRQWIGKSIPLTDISFSCVETEPKWELGMIDFILGKQTKVFIKIDCRQICFGHSVGIRSAKDQASQRCCSQYYGGTQPSQNKHDSFSVPPLLAAEMSHTQFAL